MIDLGDCTNHLSVEVMGFTIIGETEYDSLEEIVAAWEESPMDPEMQELQEKWDSVIENHEAEWYTPVSL